MTTPLNGLSDFDANGNVNLIKFFYLKKGEKLNKKQLADKKDEIAGLLIKVGSKEIKNTMLGIGTEQREGEVVETKQNSPEFQDAILNKLTAEDTETEEVETKQNKLLRWVSKSAQDSTEELTRHIAAWSVEAIQLELLTGNQLLSQLN